MATRAALASRVYIAGQSIESSMAKIAAAVGVKVPPKPGGIYGKRPELREAANQDRIAQFLASVAERVVKPDPDLSFFADSSHLPPASIAATADAASAAVGSRDITKDLRDITKDLRGLPEGYSVHTAEQATRASTPPETPKHAKPVHKPGRK